MKCNLCNGDNPVERIELGYEWCKTCAEQNPKLSRCEFVVLGQHKSTPLIMSVNDPLVQAQVSYMVV